MGKHIHIKIIKGEYFNFIFPIFQSEFEVKSIHFPGQTHKWRLARWLQLGYEKSNEYFFQNLATALRLLIITAKDRIISNKFSLVAGAKSMYKGSVRLVDMLIGLPAMNVLPYATELADEERKFLVAELKIDEKEQEKYEKYCEEIRERLKPKSKASFVLKSNFCFIIII